MRAVVKTGGKQYIVAAGDQITVERCVGEAGSTVNLDVLMVGDKIGAPFVAGATVTAEIVEQTRDDKVLIFKKKRRQNYKRLNGHKQDLTVLKITNVQA